MKGMKNVEGAALPAVGRCKVFSGTPPCFMLRDGIRVKGICGDLSY